MPFLFNTKIIRNIFIISKLQIIYTCETFGLLLIFTLKVAGISVKSNRRPADCFRKNNSSVRFQKKCFFYKQSVIKSL